VLTDRDAYLLFYARVDSTDDPVPDISLSTPSSSRPLTPVNLVNRNSFSSPSSGKKRVMEETSDESIEVESLPKRPRISDDDTKQSPNPIVKPSPNGVSKGDLIKKAQPFRIRPFAEINGNVLAEKSRKDYKEKRVPLDFSKSTSESKKDESKFTIKYDSPKDIPRPHKSRPLHVTPNNPYAREDPFYNGAMSARQRGPRPLLGGIAPAFTPGANRAFTREGLGIKSKRKHMMRT
jgi:hypothetical protein